MRQIKGLLGKFYERILERGNQKEEVLKAIQEVARVSLSQDQITIVSKKILVRATPAVRNEITMKKDAILEYLARNEKNPPTAIE